MKDFLKRLLSVFFLLIACIWSVSTIFIFWLLEGLLNAFCWIITGKTEYVEGVIEVLFVICVWPLIFVEHFSGIKFID